MSDVMSVRLHLSGVRVTGVLVDSVERLEVEVESAREWSRCRHCGFRCYRVWDRRPKRVRDLGVSGRRTTLVWRRRRFECGNCGERHLEDHALFQAGLSRRFARRLVADATVMSIRAVGRHHGVGWHRIMGLVRAHSERVAQRRRARPSRVLLVDETSIRRRHRYVTVVACGETGKVLAMIPGRTKGSLSRFFRDQGPQWCRQVEIVVSDGSRPYQAAIAQYLPAARHVLDRFHVVRWFTQGLTLVRREIQRRDPHRRPPTFEPDLFRNLFHPPAPGRSPNRSPPGAPRQTVRRSSPSPHRVGRSPRALPALRSRRPGPSQPGARTVRRSLRHRPDTANTTKSWTPSSHGENRSWPTTPPDDGYPTDPSKEPTTSTKSYDASPTGSPTPTITPPEESS